MLVKLLLQLALAAWLGAFVTYRTLTLKPPTKPKAPRKDAKSQFETTPELDLRRKVRSLPCRSHPRSIESETKKLRGTLER
jgi:hypothetical protein